ncbi:MAG: hypothetical protein HY996_05040, partial [Micrococcales bacterium]|nr:hypothetical protein [Micrococcales bacterium]
MRRLLRPLLWLAVLGVVLFGVTPQVLLWRARVIRRDAEAAARRTGRPIEDSLPAVLARIAAHSPFAASAHREEARFWMAMARSGERFEPRLGPTRRLANRINRAYSDAIRADAGWAAPTAIRRLNARGRFDLAGRKRGAALERRLASELRLARALSGMEPARCDRGSGAMEAAQRRFAPGPLGPGGAEPWSPVREALALAVRGHDDRALVALARHGDSPVAQAARG